MSQTEPSDLAGEPVHYRVLARKYRPQTLTDLIGQEPMVKTLTNAFETGRIAQAYLLTGVRGVGKTSTARILARALNYQIPGGPDRPSVDFSVPGEHCEAIMQGRHIDVIEMDAASNTGIADIREIIEAVRYKPAVARYKVYIIDEVHMLSNQAFNGLLKTLEEPPEHVKFIFATTEVRKVPVTILSRCQRFDLRRIDADRLVGLLGDIAGKEGIAVEQEALAMIARAAEGSARDALSLLDQAIAHSAAGAPLGTEELKAMLGLADRARVIDLFEQLMRGEAAEALQTMSELHDIGADPATVLEDLAAFTHLVTRLKMSPEATKDSSLTEEERKRGSAAAEKLSIRALSRTWQILLKGVDEAREASRPLAAADMVLIRIAHASDLPTPDEAIRMLQANGGAPVSGGAPAARAPAMADRTPNPPTAGPAPTPRAVANGETKAMAAAAIAPEITESAGPLLTSFEALVAHAAAQRDLKLKYELERYVRLAKFESGHIQFGLADGAPSSFTTDLGRKLGEWTGRRWIITIDRDAAAPTIYERQTQARADLEDDVRRNPVVSAVLQAFPGSEIVDIRVTAAKPDEPLLAGDEEPDSQASED